MTKKQQFFEAEYKNTLDFTPGDQLEYKYKDPHTEEKWRTWSKCWDALSGRFERRIANLDTLFIQDETPPTPAPNAPQTPPLQAQAA